MGIESIHSASDARGSEQRVNALSLSKVLMLCTPLPPLHPSKRVKCCLVAASMSSALTLCLGVDDIIGIKDSIELRMLSLQRA